ncbi:tyrosine-type recombinase/integrase [Bradyrhizobium neotropicale]|uniref:tyrosine-type recombinase/integrase n=1 Tax=Bradyrhizobium neotropicale TaxID=1497615 RepID=UPI001AD7416B|nr:tyrosine-type recombinase/integrase [Bradyrhizobium neotropicale]MBO4222024.1 tyrosine-type recombinase/integrase [Bradyrhizobium neotropicale]
MPTKIDHRNLKSSSAREKLDIAKKPYWLSLSPGIALGYRRNVGIGTWSVRYSANGADWLKKLGLADDKEKANSSLGILDFEQAKEAALKLARTQPGLPEDTNRPVTVDEALQQYKVDLQARSASVSNATTLRGHVTPSLMAKPVMLLTERELWAWRNSLMGKMKPASVNRLLNAFRAALNLAADHDSRITNRKAWKKGIANLPDAEEARNVILDDQTVGRIVLASYERNDRLGLLMHTLAESGARPSQAARLQVTDLVTTDPKAPRLMMPRAGKGGSKKRIERKIQRYAVAITMDLAQRLKEAAKGRSGRDPLLLRSDGEPWGERPYQAYGDDMAEVIAGLGLDAEVTPYALRHSSIVRWLLNSGGSVRLVAEAHDTSVAMIERYYSRYIANFIPEEISRRAMLHLPVTGAAADNVVALR